MESTQKEIIVKGGGTNSKTLTKVMFISASASLILFISLFLLYILTSGYLFSDFAETLSYCISRNPYSGVDNIHSIYPPFAFLPFYLFALICKTPLQNYLNGELTLPELVKEPSYILSFLLFYIICLAIVLFLASKISKFKGIKLVCLWIIIATSAPFIYCFYRGNNIISACIFGMLFFWLYKSDKKWQREIANLCLACAVAIKIYPIILIIFFLKDRRFLDMLKTVLYSLILLFIPFLLIDGGFSNIKLIWRNFKKFNSGEGRDMDWANISLDSLASKISMLFGSKALHGILSKLFRFGALITSIITLCLAKNSKKEMQTILIALLTYELFMGVSYAYTLTFLVYPLIMYFNNFDELSKLDKIYYGICFAFIGFSPFASFSFFLLTSISAVCLLIKSYVDIILEFKTNKKSKTTLETKSENEIEKQQKVLTNAE